MDQMVRNDIACNCILIVRMAFSVRSHLILIAFLRILLAYLCKYAAYLGCWLIVHVFCCSLRSSEDVRSTD